MEKINVSELLKDCPSGMELDCAMYENLYFDSLNADYYGTINCYTLIDGIKTSINLTKYGTFNNHPGAKCVIFPKGKTTWKGFQIPFKDGDIVAFDSKFGTQIFLFKEYIYDHNYAQCYLMLNCNGDIDFESRGYFVERFATKEEKEKLFKTIKEHGYRWNQETKTLDKLIQPKFKVGDTITNGKTSITIGYIDNEYYYEISKNIANRLFIKNQDEWCLISEKFPNKFDITTLKAFDKVLVRGGAGQKWTHDFFGFMDKDKGFPFVCVGHYVIQCIPYEGNEHLLGTTDDCDEFYKLS